MQMTMTIAPISVEFGYRPQTALVLQQLLYTICIYGDERALQERRISKAFLFLLAWLIQISILVSDLYEEWFGKRVIRINNLLMRTKNPFEKEKR